MTKNIVVTNGLHARTATIKVCTISEKCGLYVSTSSIVEDRSARSNRWGRTPPVPSLVAVKIRPNNEVHTIRRFKTRTSRVVNDLELCFDKYHSGPPVR